METFKVKDPTNLWEPWNDCGKLHIGYGVSIKCLFLLSIGPMDRRNASLFHQRLFSLHTMNVHFLAQLQLYEIMD
jgi:hypothetical protein